MRIILLIWIAVYSAILQLVYGENNPYYDALRMAPWQSIQRYAEVRPGAFLFYWFYYADGTSVGADRKPLIIWIQGGPGLAASGLANFAEIGPLNMNMEPRNHTWVKGRNLLLIDHPVGTGFSYAVNKTLYVKTDRDMAMDLLKAIKDFYKNNKSFRKTPTYIFGQSYGGKICPRLAYYLHMTISKKRLKMNFKGIGIGSGWVDPAESSLVFPNFLYSMGLIDRSTYISTMNLTKEMCQYINKRQFVMAKTLQSLILQLLAGESGSDINFNNINQVSPYPALEELEVKVNKFVKPTLHHVVNQSFKWAYRSEDAYDMLEGTFLVPSTKFVEMLLNKTKLKIAVYNGNFDVLTPLAGASNWVHKLRWKGAHEFKNKRRIKIRGDRNGFYKKVGQLSFWSVFGSGHWVPEDNPIAMQQILEHTLSDNIVEFPTIALFGPNEHTEPLFVFTEDRKS